MGRGRRGKSQRHPLEFPLRHQSLLGPKVKLKTYSIIQDVPRPVRERTRKVISIHVTLFTYFCSSWRGIYVLEETLFVFYHLDKNNGESRIC
jgi:hypothetical protein